MNIDLANKEKNDVCFCKHRPKCDCHPPEDCLLAQAMNTDISEQIQACIENLICQPSKQNEENHDYYF